MEVTKDLLVELVYKALPYSEQISKLNTVKYNDAIFFEWRGSSFRVDEGFRCDEVNDHLLMGTDKSLLLERLVKKYYLDYLK